MSRRDILTAAELAMAASALVATTYGLVAAAYTPGARVQWASVAIAGVLTALSLVGLAAILFVGRAALLLAPDAVQALRDAAGRRARRKASPPSAAAPLWRPRPADEQAGDADAAPGTGRHGRGAVAPKLASAGPKTAGGTR